MQPIRRILVATDLDAGAREPLDVALMLAARLDAHLTLLHVLTPPASSYAFYAEGLSWPVEELTAQAQKVMDGVVATARSTYAAVEGLVLGGIAWETLVEHAKTGSFDLVVLGTHGRRGLKRAVLGSVAEKVVRLSSVPVLTVPLAHAA